MLFLLTALVFLIAAVSFAIFAKRRLYPEIQTNEQKSLPDAANFRPLFAPDEDELRREEREAAYDREREENAKRELLEKQRRLEFDQFRSTWRTHPDRKTTVDLLYRASQSKNGRTYLEVCEELLDVWRGGGLSKLPADDLAQMIESHFILLPLDERTPGVSFRLREEIARLRDRKEETS